MILRILTYLTNKPWHIRMQTQNSEALQGRAVFLSARIWLVNGIHHATEWDCAGSAWVVGRVLSCVPVPDWMV